VRAREGRDRPDPTLGTPPPRDLDDVLRQALHAVADPIEPADDGLTRILHQLARPSAVRQVTLLVTDCADLARLIAIWLEPAFTVAMRFIRRDQAGYRRGFAFGAARATLRPAMPWLRPALAVAGAATIVVIGVVMLGQVHQIMTPTSLNTGTAASSQGRGGAHSAGGGHEQPSTVNLTQTGSARAGTASARAGRASHRPGSSPTPSPAVTPSASPAASPSQSPGPTPTPSTTKPGHKPHPSKTKSPKGGS
jgi:hypothetical protein